MQIHEYQRTCVLKKYAHNVPPNVPVTFPNAYNVPLGPLACSKALFTCEPLSMKMDATTKAY